MEYPTWILDPRSYPGPTLDRLYPDRAASDELARVQYRIQDLRPIVYAAGIFLGQAQVTASSAEREGEAVPPWAEESAITVYEERFLVRKSALHEARQYRNELRHHLGINNRGQPLPKGFVDEQITKV